MRQVRNGVFETNSSSVHSISICNRELEQNKMLIADDGYIHIELGEFGWAIRNYSDQYSKLSYLITMAVHLNDFYIWCCNQEERKLEIEAFMQTEDFKHISDEISKYAGCNGIIIDESEGYIDHQSIYSNSLEAFLDLNNTDIIEFVFGGVIVHTDNDNH